MATFAAHITKGVFASRPSAGSVPAGSLYAATDTNVVYQSDGSSTWSTYFVAGSMAVDALWDTKGDLAVATGADAASKLAVGSNGQFLQADSTQTTGVKWAPGGAGALTQICDLTLSGAQASIDTNTILGGNISSSYNQLQLHLLCAGSGAGAVDVHVNLNNDTGSNYDWMLSRTSGTTVTNASGIAAAFGYAGVAPGTGTANRAVGLYITIPNYTNTTFFKTLNSISGCVTAATATTFVDNIDSAWRSTAAVTRIALTLSSGNFVTGSRFTLYGIT